jgi:hypothetical protein
MIWLRTFLLTLGIELAIAFPLLGLARIPRRQRVALVLLANLLTHPIVFASTQLETTPREWLLRVVVLELAAAIVEAGLYARRAPVPVAIAASFLANAASLAVSLLIAA